MVAPNARETRMCERCWYEAGLRQEAFGGTKADHYFKILEEKRGRACTAADQKEYPRMGEEEK